MTNAEMYRRLATLSIGDIGDIALMIRQGYGAQGIKNETTFTLKQINAVFQKVQGRG